MPGSTDEVWAALALGAVSSVGLLVGAIAGLFSRMPHQPIARAMSVGAGLLLAGASLKLTADAIRVAGPMAAALSLLLGAAVFSASNALLARFGAAHRKRCGDCVRQPAESQQPGSGVAIAFGNALDAVPEAMVLGIALRDPVVPLALVIAFSVGNFPVALSSTAGMRAAGRRYPYIVLLWSAIAIGGAVAVAAGYVGAGALSEA
jgi:zinc transporter, ZIP family